MPRFLLLARTRLSFRALLAATVTLLAWVLSGGAIYLAYLWHVFRVASTSPCISSPGQCLLVFGRYSPEGQIDADFSCRLDRTAMIWHDMPPQQVLLLGGGPVGSPSEASLAHAGLRARLVSGDMKLEEGSRTTFENMINAHGLLSLQSILPRVTLISSRYHLARCGTLARKLGFEYELCAAEDKWVHSIREWRRLFAEAAYVCWADMGGMGQPIR
jgi:uncharacterized SAM-binding protein YcdF (DUF218 family)